MAYKVNTQVFNPIEGKMDQIIDVFVTFFGEKYRAQIEHNLKNTIYCFIPKKVDYYDLRNIMDNPDLRKKLLGDDAKDKSSLELTYECEKLYGQTVEDYFKQQYEKNLKFLLKTLRKENKKIYKHATMDDFDVKIYEDLLNLDEKDLTAQNTLSESQKARFVNFFKRLGYDFGEKYEDYVQNKEIQKKIISKKHIDKYKQDTQKIIEETIQNFPALKEVYEKINAANLVNANYYFQTILQFARDGGGTSAFVYLLSTKNKTAQNILCSPWGLSVCDRTLLHELGHIVESNLIEDEDYPSYMINKSGLSARLANFSESEEVLYSSNMSIKESVTGESFFDNDAIVNEVVHDYFITKDVAQIAKNKGLTLCFAENELSGYSSLFPIYEEFIEKHRDKFKEFMMQADFDYMDYFGEVEVAGKKEKLFYKMADETLNYYNFIRNHKTEYSAFTNEIKALLSELYGEDISSLYSVVEINDYLKSKGTNLMAVVSKNNKWSQESLEVVNQMLQIKATQALMTERAESLQMQ